MAGMEQLIQYIFWIFCEKQTIQTIGMISVKAISCYYDDYACPSVVICFIKSLESSGTLKSFHEVDFLGSQDEYFDFSINL